MRKAAAFRGGANKTAPPCETLVANKYLVTVPVEQLQRESLTEKSALRENDFQRPAKGGSTPAFAYQRAAIAPLPCPNLQPYCFMIQLYLNWTVLKNAIAAGKTCYKNNLLRKCGLLAHTSAAFLKNCCTEKHFICASHKPFTLLFPYRYAIMKQISERSICLCIAYSSPSLP